MAESIKEKLWKLRMCGEFDSYKLAEKLAVSYPFELDELRWLIYNGTFVYELDPVFETYAAILEYSAANAVDPDTAMDALHGTETESLNLENWSRELMKNVNDYFKPTKNYE